MTHKQKKVNGVFWAVCVNGYACNNDTEIEKQYFLYSPYQDIIGRSQSVSRELLCGHFRNPEEGERLLLEAVTRRLIKIVTLRRGSSSSMSDTDLYNSAAIVLTCSSDF